MLHVMPVIKVPRGVVNVMASPRRFAYWHHLIVPRTLRGRIVEARIGLTVIIGLPEWVSSEVVGVRGGFELDDWRALKGLPETKAFLVHPALQVHVRFELDEPQAFDAVFVFNEIELGAREGRA